MKHESFTMDLVVDQSPAEVFSLIQDVRKWWSGFYEEQIEGNTSKLNDEFTFVAARGAHFSKQKLVEIIPDQKLVWMVTDSNLSFINDNQEWIGTHISFEISRQDKGTKISFTHLGLAPHLECYEDCTMGWTQYLEAMASDLRKKNK